MHTARELYSDQVQNLPVSEQLQLATMILQGLTASAAANYSEEWSDEDLRDLTSFSLRQARESVGEE